LSDALAAGSVGARLRLLRVSNAFSPVADVLSGVCVASAAGCTPDAVRVACAALASSAIYHAGMALNDYADRADDARTRPERPIPSGAVSPREAFRWGLGLSSLALAASTIAQNWRVAAPLLAVVWTYDLAFRRGSWLGPLFLGLARALNLLAGIHAAGLDLGASARIPTFESLLPASVAPLGVAGGYGLAILGLSIFALGEDLPWSRGRAILAWCFAVVGLVVAFASLPMRGPDSQSRHVILGMCWLPLLEPLSIVLGPRRPWGPERVGQVVGASLRGTLVFHALVGVATGYPQLSVFCGIAYVLARLMARKIPPN
jgi:4-hydroxybenzoate polyprenyltransferase